MKIDICSGSKCIYYGASHLYESLEDLQESLLSMEGIDPEFTLEINFVPCSGDCKDDEKAAPVAWVNGEKISGATGPQLMTCVLNDAML